IADQQLAGHQPDKAINNYKLAIKHMPDNTNYLYKYAFAVARTGDFDNATKLAKTILKDVPEHVATKSLLVSIYEKTGQHEEGWKQIKSLSEVNPDNPYIVITFGKYALRNGQQEEAIKKLKYNLQKPNLKTDDKLSMHMLLGKLYDSIEAYSNAFSHFSQANNLKYNDYDIAVFEQQVSSYISYFTKEKYNQLVKSKNTSDAPVFILGMPRSGTSLLEQIISSHSQVYGAGELNNIPSLANALEEKNTLINFPQLLDDTNIEELDGYACEILDSMKSLSPDSKKVVDKLPHNFLFVGLIHKLFPNAKIINCVRDPIDNCLSCYFQHFGGYHPYAYNLNHLGKYYQQYQKLMRHWDIELQIPILNIHYEDVVNDTKKQIENLLCFLGLEWEEACLEFHKNKRKVNTASYTQVERKIYTESMQRWRNYEPYIQELISAI
ncbi:MAG: sulfotransferase, partial [Methylococcales bacterium]